MTPKQTEMAKFYETTPQTLYNWRARGNEGQKRRYCAMKEYYEKRTAKEVVKATT